MYAYSVRVLYTKQGTVLVSWPKSNWQNKRSKTSTLSCWCSSYKEILMGKEMTSSPSVFDRGIRAFLNMWFNTEINAMLPLALAKLNLWGRGKSDRTGDSHFLTACHPYQRKFWCQATNLNVTWTFIWKQCKTHMMMEIFSLKSTENIEIVKTVVLAFLVDKMIVIFSKLTPNMFSELTVFWNVIFNE